MELEEKHLAAPPKVVGHTSKGIKLFEAKTLGGFNMILKGTGKSLEVVGGAPHRAIARHQAEQKLEDDIIWHELSKADYVDPATFQDLLPKYNAVVDALNQALQTMNKD